MTRDILAVHRQGPSSGTPLVLLHAFPLDSSMWDRLAPMLDGVPVVAIDAPGFGGSPPADPGLDALAREVVAVVREVGADEAVVVGCSMGGYLAMAVAQEAPGLLAGIGLLGTKAGADAEAARERRLVMAADVEAGTGSEVVAPMLTSLLGATTQESRPDVVERVRRDLRDAPPAGIVWAQRSMAARPDRLETLQALPDGLPALVLRGTEDDLMGADDVGAMARALGCGVVEVPGAGHLAPLETPDRVAAELAELHRVATA